MHRPTIGRIIHVRYPHDPAMPCNAAIVAGLDYGAGRSDLIHTARFSHRGDMVPTTVDTSQGDTWHYANECPDLAALPDPS